MKTNRKIFLSCTSKDLATYRQMVRARCEQAGYEIIDMTGFGAQDRDGLQTSLGEIAPADMFVGIYAHRYGYIPNGEEKSITEAEFWEADRLDKPRFIFRYRRDFAATPDESPIKEHQDCYGEAGGLTAKGRKQNDFMDQLSALRAWASFDTEADLAQQVVSALAKHEGWRVLSTRPSRVYIGRTAQRDQIAQALADQGRVGIIGAAGLGKTLTAQQMGQQLAERYTGGVFFISLGSEIKPDDAQRNAIEAWAQAHHLGRSTPPDQITEQQFHNWIDDNKDPKLFIIDDVWKAKTAQAVAALIPDGAHVLVTGRQADLLTHLDLGQSFRLTELDAGDGLALLRDRVGVAPLDAALKNVVAAVDGHPLALEIAAAQILEYEDENPDYADDLPALLAEEQKNGELFSILTVPDDEREDSVAGLLALSYNRLPRDLKKRFRWLGAAVAPDLTWSVRLMTSLWETDTAWTDSVDTATLDNMTQRADALVTKSLLRQAGDGRYFLHRVLHFYAQSLLRHEDEFVTAHAHYENLMLALTVQFDELPPESWQALEAERDHIHELGDDYVRRIGAEDSDAESNALHFALNTQGYLFRRREVRRGAWLEMGLQLAQHTEDKKRESLFLNELALMWNALGEKHKALGFYEQALSFNQELGDQKGEATTLNNIGLVWNALGEKHKALDFYGQALPLRRAVSDRGGEATTLNNIGLVWDDLGEKEKALDYFNQALPLYKAVGDRGGEAATLNNIGRVWSALGEKEKALGFYGQALPLLRAVGDRGGEATTLNNIGRVWDDLGEKEKALDYFNQALPLCKAVGDRGGEAATLNNIGGVWDDLGDKEKALDFFNQALPLLRAVGDRGGEATMLNNMATIYFHNGNLEKAANVLEQIIPIMHVIGAIAQEAAIRFNLAYVKQKMGLLDTALEHAEAGFALLRAKNLPQDAGGVTIAEYEAFIQQVRAARDGTAPPADDQHAQAQAFIQQVVTVYQQQGRDATAAWLQQAGASPEQIADLLSRLDAQLGNTGNDPSA